MALIKAHVVQILAEKLSAESIGLEILECAEDW